MKHTLLVNGEIIPHVSGVEWSDDLSNAADTISFSTDEQIEPGAVFALLYGENTVLTGIITEYTQNEPNRFIYGGYDFGFYLNKNSIIKQFNGITITDAIKRLCSDFSIPTGSVASLSSTVRKIYKGETISDVFNELLELNTAKTGEDCYYYTCYDGTFNLKKYELNEELTGYSGEAFTIDSTKTIASPSVSVSMEDLKNKVIITDNKSDTVSKLVTVSDSSSISKYGLLQHIEKVDPEKENNLTTIAKTKLAELNKLKTTIDLTMLGDYRMRKGVIMPIECERLQLDGDYLIKSSKHSIDSMKETVTVSLELYDRSNIS